VEENQEIDSLTSITDVKYNIGINGLTSASNPSISKPNKEIVYGKL